MIQTVQVLDKTFEVYLSKDEISKRVTELGKKISPRLSRQAITLNWYAQRSLYF